MIYGTALSGVGGFDFLNTPAAKRIPTMAPIKAKIPRITHKSFVQLVFP